MLLVMGIGFIGTMVMAGCGSEEDTAEPVSNGPAAVVAPGGSGSGERPVDPRTQPR
jgi:hypothetical protein